ncbi:dipeptide/oligopeptide/nickel ABC transporter permease/ATP-binding protein [Brachybacterium sp. p3-SID1565]|uniref:dipeptide/oligopeptide/nickel ABC transporter permease/ATP-binding protein n=1 Tax=Brachybacterium sp. p3-SID1565 TaxID=2916046 RepID=UPI0021A7DE33|nr:dipeptide/oligopeptide/nickel ABC transporter permease/ATP-binding protein [Brachybacterium sp. p3-SID1565]MCT1386236.1 dipeptide/oligopeptide/nickel ABC transporter permease/ATP-binding protein [Brachybacterium sp. p3-SID1565]
MRRRLTERLSVPGLRFSGSLPLPALIALIFVGLVALAALLAPWIAPYDPLATGVPATEPSATNWFGTDGNGRDIFSRVLHGARYSLMIGIGATLVALAAAAVLGSIAATSGKVVSEILMRIMDIIMSFPGIALAAVFVAVFGNSVTILILTIAFLYTPQLTRVVRANVLAQFGEDYVSATKVMGARTPWILFKHVARNCIAPILTFATVLVADAIVFEASLSFINAGVRPPEPSWGNIMSEGKQLLLSGRWWPTFFPGLMILLTTLALNILSEGLTDSLATPKARAKVDVEADERKLSEGTGAPAGETGADNVIGPDDELAASAGVGLTEAGAVPSRVDPAHRAATDATEPDLLPVAEETGRVKVLGQGADEEDLTRRLRELREAETARGDRLIYTADAAPLLEVQNLSISFPAAHGPVRIVDDVSFSVRPGETMGLVGESGCGKSITSLAVMGLLPPTAKLEGKILFDGKDVLEMTPRQHNALRGHEMSMIYQDALSSLNPSMLIRSQLAQLTSRGGKRSAEELLELVGLDPVRTLKSYPHELSGGQRQRVLIAMALTRNPRLVMADEPTTALDVTVQKQVVDLLNELREKLGFAMVFVSHDLALVAKLAHRITVMYAGQVVEQGRTSDLLSDPRHEYTRGLLGAVLSIEAGAGRLHQVPGTVPSPQDFVAGDRFAPRSSHPELGVDQKPVLRPVEGADHLYATTPDREALLNGGTR